MLVITIVLVRGIRENATANAVLVLVKLGVVLFVIGVGTFYINRDNWTAIPVNERLLPEEVLIPDLAAEQASNVERLPKEEAKSRTRELTRQALAQFKVNEARGRSRADGEGRGRDPGRS